MKRTATLVAGLLLVTGTVFASEWKVSGNVQGTVNLINSQYGTLGSGNDDVDLTFKTEKDYGKSGVVGVKLGLDKDNDTELSLSYTKTEGDFTVATGATLINDGTVLPEAGMKTGSDTYIKWNVMGSKTTSLTFYPKEVDGMNWDKDTFNSFKDVSAGGFAVKSTVGASDFAVKLATHNGESNRDNKFALKGEFNTKVAGATINAMFGIAEKDNDVAAASKLIDDVNGLTVKGTDYGVGKYEVSKTAMAVKASYPIGKLTVNGEFNTESGEYKQTFGTKDKLEQTVTGVFAKVSYDMGAMNGYTMTPYASMKVIDQEVKYAGTKLEEKSGNIADIANAKLTNSVTTLEGGVAINQGSFTITPKLIINTSDKAIYVEEGKTDATKAEKSSTTLAVKVAYGF